MSPRRFRMRAEKGRRRLSRRVRRRFRSLDKRRLIPITALITVVLALAGFFTGLFGSSQPAQPLHPAGATIFGIHEPNSWRVNYPRVTPDQVADLISDLHGESHRYPIDWQYVEPNPPTGGSHQYDFSVYDRMYDADVARGVRPLIIVTNAPSWAWAPDIPRAGQPNGFPPGPNHFDDWAAFCAEVAKRYPKAIGIEVWNEPNFNAFWGLSTPEGQPDPAKYTAVLAAAYHAIKDQSPSMKVLGGALAPFGPGETGGRVPLTQFLNGMLDAGAAQDMDALSFHTYADNPTLSGPKLFSWAVNLARSAEQSNGVHLPLWLTEVGVTTTGPAAFTPAAQATALTTFTSWVQTQPDIDAFFVHALTEPTANDQDSEKGFALVSGDAYPFSPKPAFFALRSAVTQPPPPNPSSPLGALHLKLGGRPVQRLAHSGRIVVKARCDSTCTAKATGRLRVAGEGKALHARLGVAQDLLPAKTSGRFALVLDKKARRALRDRLARGSKAKARISVAAKDAYGSNVAEAISIRLRS
jgi:polysaccharide biosynthesis protein PslG